ncbi:tRNA-specific 2-thiouridylase [Caloramator fervidus]|uniref:tRNA-specific 2-thiouridylase MnmA n=1 Tax=Caloramator fervidus TaxID=29344 RepID=A0A1H5VW95_9CLOT|nr:tRNA 2-thiouridine(34) synthase MnmA [Caloramator fervidus]SEF91579.1 tRNA-specific 2-thiouridylase [Caloramator fervidus]
MKETVVVGMSGGVDSSVAAYLLKEQGYNVIGITMTLVPKDVFYEDKIGGCCSISAVNDARKVADKLGIYYYVMNFREVFEKKVINYFVDEYLAGKTPNPCIACNKYIKFDEFLKKANALGAKYIATGHYASIKYDEDKKRYLLLRSKDSKKDQTYMLYNLTQHQLAHTLMPLGGYTKDQVRKIAQEIGLEVYNKPDSEEICFIPDNDYAGFIKRRVPDKVKKGYFVDVNGNILGEHKGIIHYTIGQRKGLGLALGKPVFVIDIIPEKNIVVVGDEKEVFKNRLYAEDVNFIPFDKLESEMRVTAKIRYTAKEADAIIYPYKGGVIVEFDKPQRAITKGQSVVFYDNDIVVGGGIIKDIL